MTSGERMVWAAAYVQQLERSCDAADAAKVAARCVAMMHTVSAIEIDSAERAYLDDMLSTGGDR